jgi:hypothetical protein
MDQTLVYAKTPIGDEAVRQSTRVVQRNLRMMLVQVDGKLTVAELGAKLGDPKMVERSLQELEEGGYIAPILEAVSVWQETKLTMDRLKAAGSQVAADRESGSAGQDDPSSASSNFSSFGKPVLPVKEEEPAPKLPSFEERERAPGRSYTKWLLISLVVLLVLSVAGTLLFPYSRFKPEIEAELAKIWRVPVSVGDVQLKVLPLPFLQLSDVRIGDAGESEIGRIRIFEPYSMLGAGAHKLSRVQISDGKLAVGHVLSLTESSLGGDRAARSILNTVSFDGVSITAGQLLFGELLGEVGFGGDVRVERATLQTADRNLRISARAVPEGVELEMEGVGWRPTEESALTFDSLQAKGLLQKDKLVIESFDANVLGGTLKGSWLLDWSGNHLVMAGNASLARLDARKVTVHFAPSLWLEGDLTGNLRLRGVGTKWLTMWENAEATLDAIVLRGVFNGVDLGEAARRGQGAPVRAGTTKFDRLTVKITIDPQRVVGRDISLHAGLFSATGQFSATRDRQVDGNLVVTMSGSAEVRTLPVKVSGTLPNLQAAGTR